MDPFTEDVIATTQAKTLRDKGAMQRANIGAQAAGSGAFGGSRQAVAEQNLLEM